MISTNPREVIMRFKFITLPALPPKVISYNTELMLTVVAEKLGIKPEEVLRLIPSKTLIPYDYFITYKTIIAKSGTDIVSVRLARVGDAHLYQDIGRYFNPSMVLAQTDETPAPKRSRSVKDKRKPSPTYLAIRAQIEAQKAGTGLIGT